MTIEIDDKDYMVVIKNLHHGQLSHITRTFMHELAERFRNNDKKSIMAWAYGQSDFYISSTKDT